MNTDIFEDLSAMELKTPLGLYMQSRLNVATKETRDFLDEYRFNDAATVLYRYLWNEFCGWGIELSKVSKESVPELGTIFKESMKLLHPLMPFITEFLYHDLSGTSIQESDSIMIMRYPENITCNLEIEKQFNVAMDAIVTIRRAKTLVDMANQSIKTAYIKTDANVDEALMIPFITRLGKVENVSFTSEKINNAVSDVSEYVEVYIPTESIDLSPIIERLKKQSEKLDKEIGKLSGMLNNKRFVENAPKEVIEKNTQELNDATSKQNKIKDQLASLEG
jgi:valyl-tRNA synthetase